MIKERLSPLKLSIVYTMTIEWAARFTTAVARPIAPLEQVFYKQRHTPAVSSDTHPSRIMLQELHVLLERFPLKSGFLH